jgi:hypothetical protein
MIARARLRDAANGDRTPPRRELAAVITQRDQAARELADTHAAIARAKQIVTEAEHGLAQAASPLDETRHEVGKRVAQALTAGAKPEQDNSLREACIRQLDAESELAAAQSALAQLETSIEEHQYVIAQANKQANEAALAVIAAEVDKPRLIEELHAAHARWCTLHARLYWLLDHDLTGDFDPNSGYPNIQTTLTACGGAGRAWRRCVQLGISTAHAKASNTRCGINAWRRSQVMLRRRCRRRKLFAFGLAPCSRDMPEMGQYPPSQPLRGTGTWHDLQS